VLKLNLTHEEAALVGAALANMPYRQVAQLLANLEQQIRAQVPENTASDRMVQDQASPRNNISTSNS
jgi:hypothetical protein